MPPARFPSIVARVDMMGCHSPPSHFRWLKGHETARRLGKRARGRAIVWFGVDTTGYQLGLLSLGIHSTSLGHLLIYNLEVEVKLGATGVRGLTALTIIYIYIWVDENISLT